ETQRRRDVLAVGDGGGSEELGKVDELCEVDTRRRGQRLDQRAVGLLQLERGDIDGVAEEVAVGVGDGDECRAAIAAGARGSSVARRRRAAAASAAGGQAQGQSEAAALQRRAKSGSE